VPDPKVWFITGASRGFGALIARDALARGDRVVATARNPTSVTSTFGEQPNLLAVKLDVTNETQAHQAAKLAVETFGRIDVLLNNAGYGLLGAVEETGAQEVQAVFETNVFGLLNVTRAVLPYLRQQGSGHVVNMSSIGGYASHEGWGVYCATKFAVEALSEALSDELAPLGIHATVVEPGFFRTDFLSSTRSFPPNSASPTTEPRSARCDSSLQGRTTSSPVIRRSCPRPSWPLLTAQSRRSASLLAATRWLEFGTRIRLSRPN
jgi:NAD(P)-dependent dehydrogenase (short-subunit alcohol dehydrogenase family)